MNALRALLLVLVTAPSVQAQPFDWKPYAALAAAETADIVSTIDATRHGAHEANPLMGTAGPLALTLKAGDTVLTLWWMRRLERRGHPRLAHVLGYVSAAGLSVVVAQNMKQGR